MMDLVTLPWGMAMLGALVYFLAKVVLFRIVKPKNWFRLAVLLYVASLPAVYWTTGRIFDYLARAGAFSAALGPWVVAFHVAGLLGFLFLLGLTFYSTVDHSVRVRVSVEVFRAGGRIALSELFKSYDPEAAAARRFGKLTFGGYARPDGSNFVLTTKGRAFARFFWWLKNFLKIGLGDS